VGLAIGLMGVASIVGLLLPALDGGSPVTVVAGTAVGVLFLLATDRLLARELSVASSRGCSRAGMPTPLWLPLRVAGALLIVGGTAALLHAFGRFVFEGIETPAPVAPTERFVVGGLYRYVRNPMYLAVEAAILGQALLLGQPVLVLYAGIVGIAVAAFVYGYEEPTLANRFGDEYEVYRDAVPAWLPRLRAWKAVEGQGAGPDADRAHGRR